MSDYNYSRGRGVLELKRGRFNWRWLASVSGILAPGFIIYGAMSEVVWLKAGIITYSALWVVFSIVVAVKSNDNSNLGMFTQQASLWDFANALREENERAVAAEKLVEKLMTIVEPDLLPEPDNGRQKDLLDEYKKENPQKVDKAS